MTLKKWLIGMQDAELFADVDVHTYIDSVTNEEKISIFISFVQDYENNVEDLESIIIDDVIDEINDMNMLDLVDDININMIQWKNGSVTKRFLDKGVIYEE